MEKENKVSSNKSAYRSEIDGLRAFAVLSVVVFHAFPGWLKGGFIGVDIFFVISGFLITTHIFESLDKGQFSFADFFARRVRRIFPALILVMVVSLVFGWFVLLVDEYAQLGKHIASGATYIINFILVDETGYFDNAAETKPMLHLWSLAIEEQFYIIWPLVLWCAWKRKFNLFTITVIVAAISFFLNLIFVHSKPTVTFFWPIGRFWELLSGSILAWLLLYKGELLESFKLWFDKYLVRLTFSKDTLTDGSIVSSTMALVGFVLLVYGIIRIDESLAFPSLWALIPVLGTVLIIAGGSKAWLNRVIMMNPLAIWFGLISYPLYLWHWPVLSFLQIYKGDIPHRDNRITAVVISIFLAWLTYKFIENPIRFGSLRKKLNASLIALVLFSVGGIGYIISNGDLSAYHSRAVLRKGFDYAVGPSINYYEGNEDWLFLGNAHDQSIAKLRLAIEPSASDIKDIIEDFSALTEAASQSGTQVALLIGPNKSSVYTEYLPEEVAPSEKRYSTIITDELRGILNLQVVDPTDLLIKNKSDEGYLYWRTDTHWNQKGAYIAYRSLLDELKLNVPAVNFSLSGTREGDLIGIAKLDNFPLHADDNWKFEILEDSQIFAEELAVEPKDPFGWKGVVVNSKALNNMTIWVIGDSCTSLIRSYLNTSFKEVRYVGHWNDKLKTLPAELTKSDRKPDLVLLVRVERAF